MNRLNETQRDTERTFGEVIADTSRLKSVSAAYLIVYTLSYEKMHMCMPSFAYICCLDEILSHDPIAR